MNTIRLYLLAAWMGIDLCLIFSFGWYLLITRSKGDGDRVSAIAAASLMLIFIGALINQGWMWLMLRVAVSGGRSAAVTAYYPVAVAGALLAFVGGVSAIWVFRPRHVPLHKLIAGLAVLVLVVVGLFWLVQ